MGSPCSESSIEGTVDNGARSETAEKVLVEPGRRVRIGGGGEEEGMSVEEVGTGVGYERSLLADFACGDAWGRRFMGRGSVGEEEKGSNAGSRDGAGRLVPTAGEMGTGAGLGEEGILLHMWRLIQERERRRHYFIVGMRMVALWSKGRMLIN